MPDEIGYQKQSLASWASLTEQATETNPELIWPKSIEVYDKMRREDAQVGSVLRAVTLPIRSANWSIDPAGADATVVLQVAEDLGLPVKGQPPVAPLRSRGRFSWAEHLRLALLELVYGASYFEQVYEAAGDRVRLRKLAWRPPRTISEIRVADDGGLVAIEQYGTTGRAGAIKIPVDRIVAYVNEREGANWLGQSLLRNAYKNWLLKDRILRVQALVAERNGLGVPVYTAAPVPDKATTEQRTEWEQSEKDAGLRLASGFRAGEAAGASIPHGSTLDLKGVQGKLPDTDGPIRYHDEQIARAVLAHFLNLGTETGSWALGSTFANFFTDSLNAVAAHIADVTQQHVVEDLVDLNWGSTTRAPRLVFEPIGSEHPATAEAVKALIDCGAIKVDPELEAHLRTLYGLPAPAAAVAAAGVPVETARDAAERAERARFAAETVQKVYLGVPDVLTKTEAREIVRDAGADIEPATPKEEA